MGVVRAIRATWAMAVTALAALALAAPVSAETVKAACLVTAEAKVQDKQDPNLGLRYEGGKASFVIRGGFANCAGIEKGAPAIQFFDFDASGGIDNIVCGSGKAWGTIERVRGHFKYAALLVGRKFGAHVFGANGPFYWHSWDKPATPDSKQIVDVVTQNEVVKFPWPSERKDWQAAGWVSLGPALGKPSLPSIAYCTKAFSITATILLDF